LVFLVGDFVRRQWEKMFVCVTDFLCGNREKSAAQVQLISDLCDMAVPLSALGIVALDDGIVGLAGTLSSLIGITSQWAKTA